MDLSGVVHDDNLGGEGLALSGGDVLGVTSDHTTADILDGQVLDVETNVVSGESLRELDVVHLDGLDLSGQTSGGESDDHAGLEDTGLNTADGDSSDTSDLVHILKGDTEGLVSRALGLDDGIKSLNEGGALVPGEVGGPLEHVVTVPSGDGDEGDLLGVVSDLLDEGRGLLHDFVVTGLGVVGGLLIHLVDGDDHLSHTQGVGKESVLTGLTSLGNTSLELTSGGGNDQHGGISLKWYDEYMDNAKRFMR